MFKKTIARHSPCLYVQIWEHRIKVTNINTGAIFDEKPLLAIETAGKERTVIAVGNSAAMAASDTIEVINPFSHPRTLLSDFTIAEKILQHIFKTLLSKKWFIFSLSHVVVVQAMEKIEGDLTMIEDRALRELVMVLGTRDTIVYQGPELSIHNLDFEQLKASQSKPLEGESTPSSPIWFNLVIFLAVLGLFISPIKELLQILLNYFN